MSNLRDQLRQKTLGKKSAPTLVEVDGVEYELRPLTVRARGDILRRAGLIEAQTKGGKSTDVAKLQVLAVIAIVHVPGGERVFDDADLEMLLDEEAGSVVDRLGEHAIRLLNVSADKAAEKND